MSANTTKFNLYNAYKDFVRNITKGRYYLKDYEQMGAKVVCTPHRARTGKLSCLQACRIYIEDREYFVVAKCTPIHSCYIHHVNNIKYETREKQIRISKELIDYYNKSFYENKNGVKTTIQRRNFFILFAQIMLVISFATIGYSLGDFFIRTHALRDLIMTGFSAITLILSIVMIFTAIKDKPRIG